jgi:hypothetical protein
MGAGGSWQVRCSCEVYGVLFALVLRRGLALRCLQLSFAKMGQASQWSPNPSLLHAAKLSFRHEYR